MKVEQTPLEGALIISLPIFRDNRGFFMERFQEEKMVSLGLKDRFVQDNHSRSIPGVIRGLHFQTSPPQGKLVGVIRGKIIDVIVDIRKNSPTFKKHLQVELSDENGKLLWVPFGFAHGFCVLGDQPADVIYKVTGIYNPKTEFGVRWNDPAFKIHWPVANPLVSDRDQQLPLFSEDLAL